MTNQEINIAIAEACGLRLFVLHKPLHDPFGYYRENANGYTNDIEKAWRVTAEIAAKYVNGREDQPDRVIAEPAPVPNYCNDLNAMHEAEKTLNEKEAMFYLHRLFQKRLKDGSTGTIACIMDNSVFATAPQRAEAFLSTLGKWKDKAQKEGE